MRIPTASAGKRDNRLYSVLSSTPNNSRLINSSGNNLRGNNLLNLPFPFSINSTNTTSSSPQYQAGYSNDNFFSKIASNMYAFFEIIIGLVSLVGLFRLGEGLAKVRKA